MLVILVVAVVAVSSTTAINNALRLAQLRLAAHSGGGNENDDDRSEPSGEVDAAVVEKIISIHHRRQ